MKAIVCGGRRYRDRARLYQVLDAAVERLGLSFIIQGVSDGADLLAFDWAQERGIRCGSFPADWETHGRKAGPIRNQEMIDEGKPDAVIAFPGGKGTKDMIERGRAAGIRVILIDQESRDND
ncbi:DUF2493 domain-containing protein [Microvirga sp. Mcv34]|uniref:DUF2493 domain-containing protein n=1 Tax=Microvirga sp. Mcv34 TaxID=2926016 RepID=UPI0021C96846|nr:SLOG family protein [Microvirga sp. Mcv34]